MPSSAFQPERPASQRIRAAPEEVAFTVWPLRQQPLASLTLLALAATASWLVAWSSGQWLAGALVAVGLVVALWRTWLPASYEIGLSGVSQSILGRRRRIGWSAIQSHNVLADGVLLSPDPRLTSLSPLRGLYLPWLDRRDKVLASLEYYLHVPPDRSSRVHSA